MVATLTAGRQHPVRHPPARAERTDEIFEYSLLQEGRMTSFSNFEHFYLFNESATRIANISKTTDGFNRIAETQDIPDFKIIFDSVVATAKSP